MRAFPSRALYQTGLETRFTAGDSLTKRLSTCSSSAPRTADAAPAVLSPATAVSFTHWPPWGDTRI